MVVSPRHGKYAGNRITTFDSLLRTRSVRFFFHVCFINRSLALDGGFTDLQAKLLLLNFSVTHCPPDDIVHILKERQTLEVQVICSRL